MSAVASSSRSRHLPTPSSSSPSSRPSPAASRLARLPLLSLATILAFALLSPLSASATVTLYTQDGIRTSLAPAATAGSSSPAYSGLPAYDTTSLAPPPPLSPAITAGSLTLPSSANDLVTNGYGLSIPQKGNFLGFSIEMSVSDMIMGDNGGNILPPFLNYMANIRDRAGAGPIIRVGGNTQEDSTIYTHGFPGGYDVASIEKLSLQDSPTHTPVITYTLDLLYTMSNITKLVNADWYFGLAFNESMVQEGNQENIAEAAQHAQRILGSSLRGMALGNEPDLYVDHSARTAPWGLSDYMNEWTMVSEAVVSQSGVSSLTGSSGMVGPFVGPSICCQTPGFDVPDIIGAGYLTNLSSLGTFSVQHYPTNNCKINNNIIDPQVIFPDFLNHTSAVDLTALYHDASAAALQANKEIVMLEMNTASCGGFPGLSDSFGAAMWMTDWALQLAVANFSAALMHVGGQNVYYNPFTPPPGNLSSDYQWTTGSVFYSTLVVAEAFGSSNASQVADITALVADQTNANGTASVHHPSYVIYENGQPSRVVLFNFVSDPSGASTYQATLSLSGNLALPQTVSVRYFEAPSVAEQTNITWAGQTFGGSFESDGRLRGTQNTVSITCNGGKCVVPVPAPAIAVVYLTQDALGHSTDPAEGQHTFSTTVVGKGSATYDPAVLQTSNGRNGPLGVAGSNSRGSAGSLGFKSAGVPTKSLSWGMGVLGIVGAGWLAL